MRHRNDKKTLSRDTAARKALVRGLATSLVDHERIRTTEAKAKVLRPIVERLVTIAKGGTVTNRRQVLRVVHTEAAAKKLMETIAPKYATRNGGYTRILKVGPRKGDGAKMVVIEFC